MEWRMVTRYPDVRPEGGLRGETTEDSVTIRHSWSLRPGKRADRDVG